MRLAREVLALVRVRLTREAEVEDVEHLLEHLDPLVARNPERVEVGHLMRDPEPEDDPPARDPVEHDRVLGEAHRMVQGGREHGGAEADPARALQERGADEQRRDEGAAACLVELGQEDRVEPGLLGNGDLLAELLEVVVEAVSLSWIGRITPKRIASPLTRRLHREAERLGGGRDRGERPFGVPRAGRRRHHDREIDPGRVEIADAGCDRIGAERGEQVDGSSEISSTARCRSPACQAASTSARFGIERANESRCVETLAYCIT